MRVAYEYRLFKQLATAPSLPGKFIDLHFYKPRQHQLGIKTKNAIIKDYGYDVNVLEVSIEQESKKIRQVLEKEGLKIEKWEKHDIQCLKPFKIYHLEYIEALKNNQKALSDQAGQVPITFEDHLRHLNSIICENLRNFQYLHEGKKHSAHNDQLLQKWIAKDKKIVQIFQIQTDKHKSKNGVQHDTIQVKLKHHPMKKQLCYQTTLFDSKTLKIEEVVEHVQKINNHKKVVLENVSYPRLFDRLVSETQKKA